MHLTSLHIVSLLAAPSEQTRSCERKLQELFQMFTVSSDFISNFKAGDNINYNLAILRVLYKIHEEESVENQRYLRKPITITLVSIAEAMLRDFIERIQSGRRENIDDLPQAVLADIRIKKLDKLDHYIACAKKHGLFGGDITFYDQLDELRKLRNKVHIQGRGGHLEADERKAFSLARMRSAERALEYISKYLAVNYPRPAPTRGYVNALSYPWDSHYKPV